MIRVLGRGKAKSPKPEVTEVIKQVDDRADTVEKKIAKLELELKKYKDQMSKMREGPAKENVKQKAIRVLQQKKMYESQMESLRNQSFNMEQTNFMTESMKDTKTTLTAMQKGVVKMKKEMRKINIDKIDELQDQLADMMEFHEEVQDAMGRSYRTPDIDDEELEAELEALGDELALDEDKSYLDEATGDIETPGVPVSGPGPGVSDAVDTSSALVDEFGLPKLPSPSKAKIRT